MSIRDRIERWAEALWYAPPGAAFYLAAPLLGPASLVTRLASRRRRTLRLPSPALPTLAVGNLAVGGTGKTQVVCHIARLAGPGLAIVTRGYGGKLAGPIEVTAATPAGEAGDEAVMLARRLPTVRVIVAKDRAAGLAFAKTLGCTRTILDDGLQQTAVEATRRIAVFGAEAPFGNGALLPLGPLRDPLTALHPDNLVWLHGEGDGGGLPRIEVRSRTKPLGLLRLSSPEQPLEPLAGRRLFAFAGIARPERFVETLRRSGAEVVGFAAFADHRTFSSSDLATLDQAARRAGAHALVCTEKDEARLPATALPIHALRTDLEVFEGADRLSALFAQV